MLNPNFFSREKFNIFYVFGFKKIYIANSRPNFAKRKSAL